MRAKVLYIDIPLDPPGGGQISLSLILRYLNKAKFKLLVFIPHKSEFDERVKKENIPCHIVPLWKLFSAIKKADPSIVHCNSATTQYTFWSALISKLLGIPFIWHVRVTESAGWRDKIIANLSTKIFIISNAVKKKFTWISDKNRLVKIPNAVDTWAFRPGLDIEHLLNELNIEKDRKIIGIFSRIDPWKGHIFFFNSAKIIKDNIPNSMFLVVGEGENKYKNRLINHVEKLGLQDDVIYTGFRKDIPELMNLCDIIVNPSTKPEAFGRVIIEAMACGKAVVATKIGGVLEIVEDNVTGILVPPKAEQAFAQACIYLLENKEKASEIGLKGRKRVEEFFSAEENVKKIEQIYEDFIC